MKKKICKECGQRANDPESVEDFIEDSFKREYTKGFFDLDVRISKDPEKYGFLTGTGYKKEETNSETGKM